MPSAFRRAGPKAPNVTSGGSESPSTATSLLGYRGVKPWTGGIHLTSAGLNDLDVILGGGQPLGTCILLREDRWTRDLALSLVKYWTAEVSPGNSHKSRACSRILWKGLLTKLRHGSNHNRQYLRGNAL